MRSYLLVAILFCTGFSWSAYAGRVDLPSCETVCKCAPVRCGLDNSCVGYLPTECCPGNKKKLQYCSYIGEDKPCLAKGVSARCAWFCNDVHSCGR